MLNHNQNFEVLSNWKIWAAKGIIAASLIIIPVIFSLFLSSIVLVYTFSALIAGLGISLLYRTKKGIRQAADKRKRSGASNAHDLSNYH